MALAIRMSVAAAERRLLQEVHAAMTDRDPESSAPPTLTDPAPSAPPSDPGPAPASARAPTRIGRYEILERLGAGGTGTVYKAHDPELNRVVALKLLHPGIDSARLRREAQALAKLDHPNVVPIYDVGTESDAFIAMKYVDGENLRAWAAGPRSRADVLRVLQGAGRGIAAAHAAGMIHRDIKPENILVSTTGHVQVGDFGVLGESEREGEPLPTGTALTRSTALGTPAYMAPEQASGEQASFASDQFAFCATAWEALAGSRPFAGATLEELAANARAGKLAAPPRTRASRKPAGEDARATVKPALSPRLEATLRRGLSAAPSARFGSMDELLHALTPPRRIRPIAGSAALGVAALVAAVVLMRTSGDSGREALLPCGDESGLLEGTWSPKLRGGLVERAQQGGPLPPIALRAFSLLDHAALKWTASRQLACRSQPLLGRKYYEQRIGCFEELRRKLGNVARTLGERPELVRNLDAATQLESMFPVERCTRVNVARVDPPSELQRSKVEETSLALTRIQLTAGREPSPAWRAMKQLLVEVEQTGYAPLIGEVCRSAASLAIELDEYTAAAAAALRASEIADQLHDDAARAEAAALRARALAKQGNSDGATEQLAVAEAALTRSDRDPFAEVAVLHQRGEMLPATSPESITVNEKRAELARKVYGPKSMLLGLALTKLGRVHGATPKSDQALREAMEIYAQAGAAEGDLAVASIAFDKAFATRDVPGALEAQRRVVAGHEALDPDSTGTFAALDTLGMLYQGAARLEEAAVAYGRALALYDRAKMNDRGSLLSLLEELSLSQLESGTPRAALETIERGLELLAKTPKPDAPGIHIAHGRILVALGRHVEAIEVLEPLLEPAHSDPNVSFGALCWSLALAIHKTGGNRVRALELARDAERAMSSAIDRNAQEPLVAGQVRLLRATRTEIQKWREKLGAR